MIKVQVSFGNVSIEELEIRTGAKFNDEDRKWLEEHRTDTANGEKGKFHIFDMPFSIHTDPDIADKLIEILKKYNDEKAFEEDLAIKA